MPPEAICEFCAAFIKVELTDAGTRVGECALEVFRPPLSSTSTCTKFRPKGAQGAVARPRAAGEPRKYARETASTDRTVSAARAVPVHRDIPLPKEIDIAMDIHEFRSVLRQVLSEELGISQAELGGRWKGGELVLKPGKDGTQEKRIPLDAFFHKVVMIRDKLRLLEAKVNGHSGLSAEDKVQLQSYITGCYGSLTTFNVLFSNREDQFSGANSKDD